ncbi:putative Serine/threonine-protein kinase-transforming protein raf [Cinnamomum micranthum f. kanehirae]|uniref:Putative Serine/threonine-protein kinase-transforming protein raf n=1 Tax=Cinnamomum micranthum f. kanehirae TaxID=337451 RepID=A0A3S3MZX0_9MAGN|nr:putative Serine/threonine-protein kinase-transforming protein raf [Cinnamomum micranthum f. kanehirae]
MEIQKEKTRVRAATSTVAAATSTVAAASAATTVPLLKWTTATVLAATSSRYFHSNNLTQKGDVYSFGVVLLELITGQPAISRSKRNLVDWASPRIATRDIQAIVDPRLEGNYDANTLFKAGEIALACTSPRSIDRPTMTDVVAKLKDCLGTETVAEITCSLEMEQVESTSMPRFSSQPLLR